MSDCVGHCGEDTCVTPGCGDGYCPMCGALEDECICGFIDHGDDAYSEYVEMPERFRAKVQRWIVTFTRWALRLDPWE